MSNQLRTKADAETRYVIFKSVFEQLHFNVEAVFECRIIDAWHAAVHYHPIVVVRIR